MNKFSKQSIRKESFFKDDNGIELHKLLELICDSEFKNHILNYFEIQNEDNFTIPIKGSNTLFSAINRLNKKFIKQDLVSNLKDVFFDYEHGFGIKFCNLSTNEYLSALEIDAVIATPIHSGEKDFFMSLYEIDKYASKLKSKGFKDILDQNLLLLKTKEEHIKKYRIIHDNSDNTFYLRAIVSEGRYFNYDNSLTIVIALLKLHFEMINSSVIYELDYFEYNESFIRMFFKTSDQKELKGIGYLVNVLQVSNDEIKREALKFSNVCSIHYQNSKKIKENLDIKPKDIKTKVLSITHGTGPEKAFKNLELFVKSKENFESLFKE